MTREGGDVLFNNQDGRDPVTTGKRLGGLGLVGIGIAFGLPSIGCGDFLPGVMADGKTKNKNNNAAETRGSGVYEKELRPGREAYELAVKYAESLNAAGSGESIREHIKLEAKKKVTNETKDETGDFYWADFSEDARLAVRIGECVYINRHHKFITSNHLKKEGLIKFILSHEGGHGENDALIIYGLINPNLIKRDMNLDEKVCDNLLSRNNLASGRFYMEGIADLNYVRLYGFESYKGLLDIMTANGILSGREAGYRLKVVNAKLMEQLALGR